MHSTNEIAVTYFLAALKGNGHINRVRNKSATSRKTAIRLVANRGSGHLTDPDEIEINFLCRIRRIAQEFRVWHSVGIEATPNAQSAFTEQRRTIA